NITKNTDPSQCSAVVIYPQPTALDTCNLHVTVVCTPSSGSTFPKGTTTVTCTGTDTDTPPKTATCTFTVTVNDLEAPSVSCPAPTTASANGSCQAAIPNVLGGVTASDNCSTVPHIMLSQSPTAGTLVGLGPHTITVTATDEANNSAT